MTAGSAALEIRAKAFLNGASSEPATLIVRELLTALSGSSAADSYAGVAHNMSAGSVSQRTPTSGGEMQGTEPERRSRAAAADEPRPPAPFEPKEIVRDGELSKSTETTSVPRPPLEAIRQAAKLVESEARKWEHAHSKTGQHWRDTATALQGFLLAADVTADLAACAEAVAVPLEQNTEDDLADWVPEFTVWTVRRGSRFPMVIDSLWVRKDLAEKRAALMGKGQGWIAAPYSHLRQRHKAEPASAVTVPSAREEAAKRCGAVSGQFACDRDHGHAGMHRGYNIQIDEPIFWNNLAASAPSADLRAILDEIRELFIQEGLSREFYYNNEDAVPTRRLCAECDKAPSNHEPRCKVGRFEAALDRGDTR